MGIEHIQRIDDMRLAFLVPSLKPVSAGSHRGVPEGIEVQGNPWGIAQEKRDEWAEGLDIPQMAELRIPPIST